MDRSGKWIVRPYKNRFAVKRSNAPGRGQLMDTSDKSTSLENGAHLTELETSWTTIRTAHIAGPEGQAAMGELIGRYHDAVLSYLRLKLRDSNLADEVFQEFWTKLLTHKLAGADCNKGRFRDYLRTVLHRLIIDHFRGRKLQSLPPGDLLDPSQPDADYDRVWRDAVLKRALTRLETYELKTSKNRYATVLALRRDQRGQVDRGDRGQAQRTDRQQGHTRVLSQDAAASPEQVLRTPHPGTAGDDPPRHRRGHRGRDPGPRPRTRNIVGISRRSTATDRSGSTSRHSPPHPPFSQSPTRHAESYPR